MITLLLPLSCCWGLSLFIYFSSVFYLNFISTDLCYWFSLICYFFSLFAIFILEGITGLSLETIKENWSSDYQKTNNAGIPQPDGSVTWNFKYDYVDFFYLLIFLYLSFMVYIFESFCKKLNYQCALDFTFCQQVSCGKSPSTVFNWSKWYVVNLRKHHNHMSFIWLNLYMLWLKSQKDHFVVFTYMLLTSHLLVYNHHYWWFDV